MEEVTITLDGLTIPVKIIYELVTSMVKDDDAGLDVHKKIGSTVFGMMIAISLSFAVTQVINPLVRNTSDVLLVFDLKAVHEESDYRQKCHAEHPQQTTEKLCDRISDYIFKILVKDHIEESIAFHHVFVFVLGVLDSILYGYDMSFFFFLFSARFFGRGVILFYLFVG